jgi:polyribonucleotide nucleotidyltransferase
MEKTYTLPEFGYEVTLGKFAGQASGAAWLKQGGTVILATVVTAPSTDFLGFFPLTVDYRELFSAAGKIPGGYFKREGKASDREVLTGRIIDRAVRPLFPHNFFDQIQAVATVYSVDKVSLLQPLAVVAMSLALSTSKIPFMGPIGACEIARVGGVWTYNPTYEQTLVSDARLLVVGNDDGIVMVEAACSEVDEADLVDVFFKAHETIKKQIAWQRDIVADHAVEKMTVVDSFDWAEWKKYADDFLTEEKIDALFITDKVERSKGFNELTADFFVQYATEAELIAKERKFLSYIFDYVLKQKITDRMFIRKQRIDLRDFETIRPIASEVGLLPFCHGSSLFKRGRTQMLTSVTLGSGQDEMRVDSFRGDETDKAVMLHYNFPSFSVGEVRADRGPSRRSVGHGHLALSAIEKVLPQKEVFPYTIRIVADALESDGSSSMATVCGSTLALMDAGVPIDKMVSGIAMGLLHSSEGKFQVLTDMSGFEDAYGLMDFKVAGTDTGVTAIQLDIKYKSGLSRQIFIDALTQARRGRLHILEEMRKVMSEPRKEMSSLVPKNVIVRVPTDKIGAIIGSGGKIIKEIIERTGTSIDIGDDGLVKIFGQPGEKLDQAVRLVELLGGKIVVGDVYNGKIRRQAEFGYFVELAPGLDGLVHVSTVSRNDQQAFMEHYKNDDDVLVRVMDYDTMNGRIRLKIVESENN